MKRTSGIKQHILIFLAAALICLHPVTVFADIGPKPNTHISFRGYEGEFYVTLFSKESSSGPWDHWNVDSNLRVNSGLVASGEIDNIFLAYSDPDGYFYLGYVQKCSSKTDFDWSYYAPEQFKVVIYFPEQGIISRSAAIEKKDFSAYYNVFNESGMIRVESSGFTIQVVLFLLRVFATLLVECAAARMFFIKGKGNYAKIVFINIVTQLVFNAVVWQQGGAGSMARGFSGMIFLPLLEIGIFAVEGFFYSVTTEIESPFVYSLSANILSLIVGLVIPFEKVIPFARTLPGITL